MKINKNKRPCDAFGFPLALNWNIVLQNQAQGKPLTQGAYIITDNNQTTKKQKWKRQKKQKTRKDMITKWSPLRLAVRTQGRSICYSSLKKTTTWANVTSRQYRLASYRKSWAQMILRSLALETGKLRNMLANNGKKTQRPWAHTLISNWSEQNNHKTSPLDFVLGAFLLVKHRSIEHCSKVSTPPYYHQRARKFLGVPGKFINNK